jgi:hypothetical protein
VRRRAPSMHPPVEGRSRGRVACELQVGFRVGELDPRGRSAGELQPFPVHAGAQPLDRSVCESRPWPWPPRAGAWSSRANGKRDAKEGEDGGAPPSPRPPQTRASPAAVDLAGTSRMRPAPLHAAPRHPAATEQLARTGSGGAKSRDRASF